MYYLVGNEVGMISRDEAQIQIGNNLSLSQKIEPMQGKTRQNTYKTHINSEAFWSVSRQMFHHLRLANSVGLYSADLDLRPVWTLLFYCMCLFVCLALHRLSNNYLYVQIHNYLYNCHYLCMSCIATKWRVHKRKPRLCIS